MDKGLRTRVFVILGILLLAVYGIIGLPRSVADLAANLKKNIRLGLDLKAAATWSCRSRCRTP